MYNIDGRYPRDKPIIASLYDHIKRKFVGMLLFAVRNVNNIITKLTEAWLSDAETVFILDSQLLAIDGNSPEFFSLYHPHLFSHIPFPRTKTEDNLKLLKLVLYERHIILFSLKTAIIVCESGWSGESVIS